jgi:GNAT superfamily N-acetyltransferase
MTLIIREAVEKDVETIMEFIYALSDHQKSRQYVITDIKTLEDQGFGPDKKFGTLLADIDGATVGYLTYVWNYSTWAGGQYMYVENLFVLEHKRRSGVGAALMQGAKVVCENNGCIHLKWEVESDNENAISFYRKIGATIAFRGVASCKVK